MALADMEASLNRLGGIYAQLDGLDAQIIELRNQRDAAVGGPVGPREASRIPL